MTRLLLTLLLFAYQSPAGAADKPRAGNPRGYETDILADTFGYGPGDIDADYDQVFQGCPRRDCIPSIDAPRFGKARDVNYLDDDDIVIALTVDGMTRAYPTRILDRHEIVNDRFGDMPVAVTYCPLCGSGVAYLGRIGGSETEFGVSGLLHNNDLIMYDRISDSLWQQITGRALAGPHRGEKLRALPLTMTAWGEWRAANPDAQVLIPPADPEMYRENPYGDYASSNRLLFPVSAQDARLHAKKVVYGLETGGQPIAVESGWLLKQGGWSQDVNGKPLRLSVDASGGVTASLDGKPLAVHRMYWFAWYSFHPNTALIDKRNH